jgi:hypothetical protein
MASTQRIRWCTPQCALDIANNIAWGHVPATVHDDLAAGLRKLLAREKLPAIQTGHEPKRPATPPPLRVAPDVPQVILDSFNGIDWTRVPATRQRTLATRLAGFITGPLGRMMYNLPLREW